MEWTQMKKQLPCNKYWFKRNKKKRQAEKIKIKDETTKIEGNIMRNGKKYINK